jgi:hypothetical protein
VTGNLAGVNVDFVAPGSGAGGMFSSTGTGTAVVGTDAQGLATAPVFTANFTAGSYHVDAESDYGTVELALTNTASGVPVAIGSQGGDGQQATVNTAYQQPLQAGVTDASGAPVQGAAVTFSVVPGTTGAGASFLGGQGAAVTGSNGVATSPPLLANGSPGRFTVVASVGGLTAVALYSLDNHAATTTIAVLATADPAARVGSRYRVPLRARVLDASGAPVEGAGVTFSIDAAAGGAGATFPGGAGQATELTDANGVATSPSLFANSTAGAFTATADVTGTADPAVFTLRNRAAAPRRSPPVSPPGSRRSWGDRLPFHSSSPSPTATATPSPARRSSSTHPPAGPADGSPWVRRGGTPRPSRERLAAAASRSPRGSGRTTGRAATSSP